jgi:hypothetical protein
MNYTDAYAHVQIIVRPCHAFWVIRGMIRDLRILQTIFSSKTIYFKIGEIIDNGREA